MRVAMSGAAMRCPDCRRILFPNRDGVLPRHKVPPRSEAKGRVGRYASTASVPLTASDAPWCDPFGPGVF